PAIGGFVCNSARLRATQALEKAVQAHFAAKIRGSPLQDHSSLTSEIRLAEEVPPVPAEPRHMFHLPCQACFERANRSTPKRLCGTQKGRPLYGGSVGLTGLTTVVLVSLCGVSFFGRTVGKVLCGIGAGVGGLV